MNEYTPRTPILPIPVTSRNIRKNLREMSKAKKASNCEFIAGRRQIFFSSPKLTGRLWPSNPTSYSMDSGG